LQLQTLIDKIQYQSKMLIGWNKRVSLLNAAQLKSSSFYRLSTQFSSSC